MKRIAVVGAGWAGLAAAIGACDAGHAVTVFEAASTLGGRARALPCTLPDGLAVTLDNGQHILVGAYTETLALLHKLGVDSQAALLRCPLSLPFADGSGLQTPAWARGWAPPWDALAAMLGARGWSWADRWALLRTSRRWQRQGFVCAPDGTVAQLCADLTPRVCQDLIEPLCVSALNTPASQASAQVFLRVLQDALFGVRGGSHLLLPRTDLGSLFPNAAADWLEARGAWVYTGRRVQQLRWENGQWGIDDQLFDHVVWATSVPNWSLSRMNTSFIAPDFIVKQIAEWTATAQALQHLPIATVYAWGAQAQLAHPLLALRNSAQEPAQFAFDRGQLGGPKGLLAFVVSAAQGGRAALQDAVLAQARRQLGLTGLQPVQTVVEKRATFACTPGLLRPASSIAPGLSAVGDYVDGPYPATLEGAVRSGLAAARALH